MLQVNDGDRVLQFNGALLAHASSRKPHAERWVEFDLYRTAGGAYVVSRVGYSRLFHAKGCSVVRPGRHSPAPVAALAEDATPCSLCAPDISVDRANEIVYPELPLHWAQACTTPEAAVEALAMYDADGNRYFTRVARELIAKAADEDWQLRDAFFVETIA